MKMVNQSQKAPRKPKRKVAVMLGYCGTGYNGMQVQNDPNVKTIEKIFMMLWPLPEPYRLKMLLI